MTGGGQSFDNRSPFLGLNYNISLIGVFPSQSLDAEEGAADEESTLGEGFVSGTEILDEAAALPLIEALIAEGINRWEAAGIDADDVERLESATFELRDLASGRLAAVEADLIIIDRDASNRGWFIDVTPGDDVEFGDIDPRTGELVGTTDDSFRHYDLLTTIMHEQGHILGLEHTFNPGDLMYGGLAVGGRKLPSASEVALIDHNFEGSPFLSANPAVA